MVFNGSVIDKLKSIYDGNYAPVNRGLLYQKCRPRFGEWNLLDSPLGHRPPKGSLYKIKCLSVGPSPGIDTTATIEADGGNLPSRTIAIMYLSETQPGYKWGDV